MKVNGEMIWVFNQIGAPIRYLFIRQGDGLFKSKRAYDFILPVLFSTITTGLLLYFSIPMGFFSDKGIVVGIINLLNLIIAFFIAALAAVATFERAGLDEKMKGEPAILKMQSKSGIMKEYILTHRQFVCYLFGYLSFISLLFLISIHLLRLFGMPVFTSVNNVYLLFVLRAISIEVFFFLFWQIVFTMFLGIYFLCDRLQFMSEPDF